ncbi:MAG: hypothetical protein PF503_24205 [Desulfobacula sp.]|nr:hypothetical protein [Desulfobacula sp.]
MIAKIHVHPKVEKILEQMITQEKAPSIAAKRAKMIIQSLVKGVKPSQAGRLSIKKDVRINNLFKFNLGSGYRLVCIKEKYNMHILFVGSHDNCDTWLDHHSKKKPHKTDIPMNVYGVDTSGTDSKTPKVVDEIDCESFLISKITQEDLKKIFNGLIEKIRI